MLMSLIKVPDASHGAQSALNEINVVLRNAHPHGNDRFFNPRENVRRAGRDAAHHRVGMAARVLRQRVGGYVDA